MENFIAYNPTKLHFGKGVLNDLPETVNVYGKNILLVYGRGSIKRSGIYDQVIEKLKQAGSLITEYSGIKSNPVIEDVDKAARLGRDKNIDAIVAVGGGSVIDSAKIISLAVANDFRGWDIMKQRTNPQKRAPLIAILTLAATGTEMNQVAVLQNHETEEKIGYRHDLMYPTHSFLDPEFTYSVPRNYTAYGVTDLIAHCFELYFGAGDCSLSDRFIEAIVKDAMEWGPKVIENPTNYEYRANIMWDATNALNGLTGYGKVSGDWGVHAIGHVLSLLQDVPHGASLSISYPAWLKLHKNRAANRIQKLGGQLFNTDSVDETISRIEKLFASLECPVRLSEVEISNNQLPEIKRVMNKNKTTGLNYRLQPEDYDVLVDVMK